MTVPFLSCPYCNSNVPRPAPMPPGGRVLCPRCGEVFPCRVTEESSNGPPASGDPASAEPVPVPPPGPRLSNKAIAAVVLGLMAVMAVAGLIFALQTASVRRGHDVDIAKPQVVSVPLPVKIASNLWILGLVVLLLGLWRDRFRRVAGGPFARVNWLPWAVGLVVLLIGVSVSVNFLTGTIRRQSSQLASELGPSVVRVKTPAQLEALAYLPADSNIIAAVHVSDLLQTPEGIAFLSSWRLGPIDFGRDEVEQWAGVKRDEIDHVALSLKFDELLVPRAIVVVRTRQPFDAGAVVQTLGATRLTQAGGKNRFRIRVGGLDAVVWFPPEGHTLVYALTAKDLDAVPPQPGPGVGHLAAALAGLLSERMNQPTPAWVAGHSGQWDKTVLHAWLMTRPPAEQQALGKVRTFGVWLTMAGDVTVNATAECGDEVAAQVLGRFVEHRVQPALDTIRVAHDGRWVTAQARGRADAVRRIFEADPDQPEQR